MKTLTLNYDETKVIGGLTTDPSRSPEIDGFNIYNLVVEDTKGIAVIIVTRDGTTLHEGDFEAMMEGLERLAALTLKGYVLLAAKRKGR